MFRLCYKARNISFILSLPPQASQFNGRLKFVHNKQGFLILGVVNSRKAWVSMPLIPDYLF